MHSEEFAAIALSRIAGIGPKIFRLLTDRFGSAAAVLSAQPKDLIGVPGLPANVIAGFSRADHLREAERISKFCRSADVSVLRLGEPDYPAALRAFDVAPPVLYHYGNTDFSTLRTVAVVGTRRMSEEGSRQVERLIDPLAAYDPLIVSGLAYGVDAAAHRRCLTVGLPTLAVMGSGMKHVYPYCHRLLARRIASGRGGLLTEYPHWIKPQREHFPARNRIVAMLADLTLVVESRLEGGSMITARMAGDLGKRVGACPGRGGDPVTAGCNALIREGRAHLIDGPEDIARLLGWCDNKGSTIQMRLFDHLSGDERTIADHLRSGAVITVNDLIVDLGLPPARIAGLLLEMEMNGILKALPGNRYRLSATK